MANLKLAANDGFGTHLPTRSSSSLQNPVLYRSPVGDSHDLKKLCREAIDIGDCSDVLEKVFGHSEYKGKQKEIIEHAVLGIDVFVLAPTGMGKSLCFQVPAVVDKCGITIVVSPLLALIKNQVVRLRQINVPVVALTSETSSEERQDIIKDISSGVPRNRLLYITPEKLCTAHFMKLLTNVYKNSRLNRLVIDEAHCISEWGHDFRAEYRRLGSFRDHFPDIPIMALTATATSAVQIDIMRTLKMSEEHLFKVVHPFNRANLYYEVQYISTPNPVSQMASVYEYIMTLHRRRKRPSSGIIYCRMRKTCDELSAYLRGKGLSSRPYHRGISASTLDATLKEWEVGGSGNGGVDVVCATIAFGMGIDKADVRYIIHYDLPKSFEGYYQETGRAGRDGDPAKCILYYSREDLIRVKRWIAWSRTRRTNASDAPTPSPRAVDSLMELANFAESTKLCRHISICRYFGEPIDADNPQIAKKYCDSMCDICKYPDKTKCRKLRLSSEEYAGTQVPQYISDGDDEYPRAGKCEQNKNTGKVGWKSNDIDHPVLRAPAYGITSEDGSASAHKQMRGTKRFIVDTRTSENGKKTKFNTFAHLPLSSSKQFNSAPLLKKPFKTPFRTPPVKAQATPSLVHLGVPEEEPIALCDVAENSPELVETNEERFDYNLQVSFSQKIPTPLRHSGITAIRHALHEVFMTGSTQDVVWAHVKHVPNDDDSRNQALTAIAEELEFSCHSMCTTVGGYSQRTTEKVDLVKMLSKSRVWCADGSDDLDDVREIIETLECVCKNQKSKGKARAPLD